MVRALFAVAGALQPAVIFIDEIDSILSARKSEGAIHLVHMRCSISAVCIISACVTCTLLSRAVTMLRM